VESGYQQYAQHLQHSPYAFARCHAISFYRKMMLG
jgi:hypothetical protein